MRACPSIFSETWNFLDYSFPSSTDGKCADPPILATFCKPDPELSAAEGMQLLSITSYLLLATFPDQLSHHMNAEVSFNMRSYIIKSWHATLINYISYV